MLKNRHQRRAEKTAFKKQIANSTFDAFENKTLEAQPTMSKVRMGVFKAFYVNSIYSVQIYERNGFTLLGIRRHDQAPICPWAHKQRIKDELIGEQHFAIEIFPSKALLVDAANMYWLWCSDEVTKLCLATGGISHQ